MKISLLEVLSITNGRVQSDTKNIVFHGISTDSRDIKKGCLFIPLKGKRFDGHDFIFTAIKKGAFGALSEKPIKNFPKNKVLIVLPKTKDKNFYPTLKALHQIAEYYRKKMNPKIVAITGSCGKTTTKDMIHSVLSFYAPTLKTEENFNNEIGVPKTLLNLEQKHKFAVIEMGMQDKNEISPLSKITNPDIAIITNIGEAHIQQLKTKSNIAKAKSEIFDGLKSDGIAILNADDEYFNFLTRKARQKTRKLMTIAINNEADFKAQNIVLKDDFCKFTLILNNKKHTFEIPIPGLHNIYNALFAIAVGCYFNVPINLIKKGLRYFKLSKNRMEIKKVGMIKFINDTYNANPTSMSAALKMLSTQKGRKIAVIGDMLELGKNRKIFHRQIGSLLKELSIDFVVSIGKNAKEYTKHLDKNSKHFTNKNEATNFLMNFIKSGDVVLFKASRGEKLEEVFQKIIDNLS